MTNEIKDWKTRPFIDKVNLASVNIKLKKEVIEKLDKHNLEMMEMVIDDMGDKVREFNKGIEEIIKFYESL